MHNATEITLILTDWALIGLVLLFIVYNALIIQFSPEIKKFIKEKAFRKKAI